jgi:flagellar hook-basal body complex protein FliE
MIGGISGIEGMAQAAQSVERPTGRQQNTETFLQTLKGYVKDTASLQDKANQSIQDFSTGEKTSIHEVMIDIEKAGTSLKLMKRMRGEALDAYDKIMRLRV